MVEQEQTDYFYNIGTEPCTFAYLLSMAPLVTVELNGYNISVMAYKIFSVHYPLLHRKSLLDSTLESDFYPTFELEMLL